MSTSLPPVRLRQLTSETLADQAYAALREAIISGELAPRETITERGLADRLAVSATPVREALRRLEQDQLVERHGPRAVKVVDLDDERLADETRLIEGRLRALAARLACTKATAEQLAQMEDVLDDADERFERLRVAADVTTDDHAEDIAALVQLTRDFHQVVNEASNNAVLLRLLRLVDAFSHAHRVRAVRSELRRGEADRDAVARRYGEHRAVLEAVRDGDGDEAERLMLVHAAARTDPHTG